MLLPRSLRAWRTRVDPFELAWPLVRRWLEAEPDRTAKEFFQRIQTGQPGIFPDNQLRTLQRRVQEWRTAADSYWPTPVARIPATILPARPGNILT